MVTRTYLQCNVCKSVIVVRTQIGHLERHPIRFSCGKCEVSITGECLIDQKSVHFSIQFDNGEILNPENLSIEAQYEIEISGEFLTKKMISLDETGYLPPTTPFMNAMLLMDSNDQEKFAEKISHLIHFPKEDWAYLRQLHELWNLKKYEYLLEQLRENLPEVLFPLHNKLEYLRGIHQLYMMGFSPMLPDGFFEKTADTMFENIEKIGIGQHNFSEMFQYFQEKGLLDQYEKKILNLLDSFVAHYPFFISATGISFFKRPISYEEYGTTTTTFEDVKDLYQDCFEGIATMFPLVLAYNNLLYRQDFSKMQESTFPAIHTMDDFLKKMKNNGNKLKFLQNKEFFNELIALDSDHDLRNAIGHGSYQYHGLTQVLTFYGSGEMHKGDAKELYLLEFIEKTLKQVETLMLLLELVYQTRKGCLIFCEGIPLTDPSVLDLSQFDKPTPSC